MNGWWFFGFCLPISIALLAPYYYLHSTSTSISSTNPPTSKIDPCKQKNSLRTLCLAIRYSDRVESREGDEDEGLGPGFVSKRTDEEVAAARKLAAARLAYTRRFLASQMANFSSVCEMIGVKLNVTGDDDEFGIWSGNGDGNGNGKFGRGGLLNGDGVFR